VLLPLRSEWLPLGKEGSPATAAAKLTEFALTMARVKGWLQVQPPPASENSEFPYHLVFRSHRNGSEVVEGTEITSGAYDLYLQRDKGYDASHDVPPRSVYVFAINPEGKSVLLFPRNGNLQNRFPAMDENMHTEAEIRLEPPIRVHGPYGYDIYFVLASREALNDLSIFTFDGVRRERTRNASNSLLNLIMGLQEGKRDSAPVPADWSLERRIVHSSE
jgi:hypothetical protein